MAIQLVIAAFSSFLVVGLVSMYDPSTIEGGQLDAGVAGPANDDLVAALAEVDGVQPVPYDDADQARADFQRGSVDTVLIATRSAAGRLEIVGLVPDQDVRSTVIVVQLRDTLSQVAAYERAVLADRLTFEPLTLPADGDSSPYFGFTYTVLVPLLLFLPVFLSGSIAVDSISEELDRGTFELLLTAPLTVGGIIDAKLAAAALLAPAQALLWIGLLWVNGITVANAGLLIGLVGALAAALVAVGLGIALLVPDRRQAQLLYSVGVLAGFVLAVLLPEHPANTVAKLAIDTAATDTYLLTAGYLIGSVVVFLGAREAISRFNPDSLTDQG